MINFKSIEIVENNLLFFKKSYNTQIPISNAAAIFLDEIKGSRESQTL